MAKQQAKRHDFKVSGNRVIQGRKPDRSDAADIDDLVSPCGEWFDKLETRCVRSCCGLAAFALSDREIQEAIGAQDRGAAALAFERLLGAVSELREHSVRSCILGDVVERQTFLEVLNRFVQGLREPSA